MFKLDLEKAEKPEIKLPTSVGSLKILKDMGIPNYFTVALISHASNAQNSPSQASAICEPFCFGHCEFELCLGQPSKEMLGSWKPWPNFRKRSGQRTRI